MILQNPPYKTGSLTIHKYSFVDTLGKQEMEEAAARLLTICKEMGTWSGVKWGLIAEQITADLQENEKMDTLRDENLRKVRKYNLEISTWKRNAFLSLGIYALFVKRPVMEKLSDFPEVPFSQVTIFGVSGVQSVINGFHLLVEQGYLEKVVEDDGDTLSPTLKLLEAVKKYVDEPDFNRNHPERKDDEVFITNSDSEDFSDIGWKTKRYGVDAYDIHGKRFSEYPRTFPVFAKISEILNVPNGKQILERLL